MNTPKVRPGNFSRIVASVLLTVLLFALGVPPASTQRFVPSFEDIVSNLSSVNSSLQSFQVEQVIEARFLFFRITLNSTVYAVRPARYRVIVHNPPWFLGSLGSVFTHVGSPQDVLVLYIPSEISWRPNGGREVLYVHAVKRRPDVNPPSAEGYIDPDRWLFERLIGHYDWGDVDAEYNYGFVEGYLLPSIIRVRVPKYFIEATLTYKNYQVNVPIADSLFDGP